MSNSPTIMTRRDPRRPDSGYGRLHESRASARQTRRQADRHLGVRVRGLRDVDRPAGVWRRHRLRHDRQRARARNRVGSDSRRQPPQASSDSCVDASSATCRLVCTTSPMRAWTWTMRMIPAALLQRRRPEAARRRSGRLRRGSSSPYWPLGWSQASGRSRHPSVYSPSASGAVHAAGRAGRSAGTTDSCRRHQPRRSRPSCSAQEAIPRSPPQTTSISAASATSAPR